MKGKTVLVTGATDGIGKATALQLAGLGARVIVHGRSADRIQRVVGEISEAKGIPAEGLQADFSSIACVRDCGAEILKRFSRLDVLVHNAGVFEADRRLTVDGFESTFAVNHLAPFLLTHAVLDLLRQSAPARIVLVSSITHVNSACDFNNLQGEKSYDGRKAYSLSKLANALFTVELAQRLRGSGITVNCLHPGVIATKLLRAGFGNMSAASTARGAETSVYLSSSQEVEGVSGKYFVNRQEADPSPLVHNVAFRSRLWQLTELYVGIPAGHYGEANGRPS
ncbi:MAG TPA: short-chain dehydrogenase [Syntrophobacteraceae bacterium]|nr:short-chain dehydrogenase [Syntrophobacteraceae bacterium]